MNHGILFYLSYNLRVYDKKSFAVAVETTAKLFLIFLMIDNIEGNLS